MILEGELTMSSLGEKHSKNQHTIDYDKIDRMDSFNTFVKKKNTLLFTITACFLTFYILLPILAFTSVLQQKWIGDITGVWVYSSALFIMTVVLAMVYSKIAPKLDAQAAAVLAEYEKDGGK